MAATANATPYSPEENVVHAVPPTVTQPTAGAATTTRLRPRGHRTGSVILVALLSL